MTRVVGTQITAAFITPECRANRGDEGAWQEAVVRLGQQYFEIVQAWEGRPEQPTLNLILTMERPPVVNPEAFRAAQRLLAKGDTDGLLKMASKGVEQRAEDAARAAREGGHPLSEASADPSEPPSRGRSGL